MNHEDGGMTMKKNEGKTILELLSERLILKKGRKPGWR